MFWRRKLKDGAHAEEELERSSAELGGRLDELCYQLERAVETLQERIADQDDDRTDAHPLGE